MAFDCPYKLLRTPPRVKGVMVDMLPGYPAKSYLMDDQLCRSMYIEMRLFYYFYFTV